MQAIVPALPLSYSPMVRGDRIRTDNLALMRRVRPCGWGTPSFNGGPGGGRTRGLRDAVAVRSRLRYRPIGWDGYVQVTRAVRSLAGAHQDANLVDTLTACCST